MLSFNTFPLKCREARNLQICAPFLQIHRRADLETPVLLTGNVECVHLRTSVKQFPLAHQKKRLSDYDMALAELEHWVNVLVMLSKALRA